MAQKEGGRIVLNRRPPGRDSAAFRRLYGYSVTPSAAGVHPDYVEEGAPLRPRLTRRLDVGIGLRGIAAEISGRGRSGASMVRNGVSKAATGRRRASRRLHHGEEFGILDFGFAIELYKGAG